MGSRLWRLSHPGTASFAHILSHTRPSGPGPGIGLSGYPYAALYACQEIAPLSHFPHYGTIDRSQDCEVNMLSGRICDAIYPVHTGASATTTRT